MTDETRLAVKIPTEWKTQQRTRKTEDGDVTDGVMSGGDGVMSSGGMVGSFVVGPHHTLVTISTTRADWLVRVMAPAPLEDCLEAALLAAVRAGVAER